MTSFVKVCIEALVIAISFVVLFFVVHSLAMMLLHDAAMTNHVYLGLQIALTAGIFHIACELTGVNKWYCKHRKD